MIVFSAAEDAVRAGHNIINLSDKLQDLQDSSDSEDLAGLTYIPPLMAVAAVHHRLIKTGLRTQASISITTGQVWSTHHVACLLGFGANAVVPYTAFDAVINWHGQKRTQNAMTRGDFGAISAEKALLNYRSALDKGLLKIMYVL
jgi:glutamate synthase (ferredoxin)